MLMILGFALLVLFCFFWLLSEAKTTVEATHRIACFFQNVGVCIYIIKAIYKNKSNLLCTIRYKRFYANGLICSKSWCTIEMTSG